MNGRKLMGGLLAVLMVSSICFAGEMDGLANLLAEKGVISYGDAQQLMTESREQSRTAIAQGKHDTLPLWLQNISLKGDLRLRHQVDWSGTGNTVRERERLRLRLGFDTRVVENLKAGFGLATGSERFADASVSVSSVTHTGTVPGTPVLDAEPSSTNHTFGNGFTKPVVMIDYAFLEYTPLSWLKVTGGKMKAGTQVWHTTDLQWDSDINPDGIAVTAARKFGPVDTFLTGSWLILNELNSATQTNPDVYIAQPGASLNIGEKVNVKAAVALEQFNVNAKNTGYYGTPAFDYVVTAPSLSISFKEVLFGYSAKVFGDTVANGDGKPTADKAGSAFGAQVGCEKITGFGDWQATYMSRRLETNSWVSKLGDSDAYGGACNAGGFEAIVALGLTSSAQLNIDYYSMDLVTGATATTPKSLIQCDVVYKF